MQENFFQLLPRNLKRFDQNLLISSQIIMLDSDNVPVRDPSFLLESGQYLRTGSLFWPDFWSGEWTWGSISSWHPIWRILQLNPKEYEHQTQESGQLVINKKKAWKALMLATYLNLHYNYFYNDLEMLMGDKDTFWLSWAKTQTPYYMIPYKIGSAGTC
jgi:alpha 1,2-mannosyltransferase